MWDHNGNTILCPLKFLLYFKSIQATVDIENMNYPRRTPNERVFLGLYILSDYAVVIASYITGLCTHFNALKLKH